MGEDWGFRCGEGRGRGRGRGRRGRGGDIFLEKEYLLAFNELSD